MPSPTHLRRAPLLLLALLLPGAASAYEDSVLGTVTLEAQGDGFIVRSTSKGTTQECFAALQCTPSGARDLCSATLRLGPGDAGTWEDEGRLTLDYQAGTATWRGIEAPSASASEVEHWRDVVGAVMLQRPR